MQRIAYLKLVTVLVITVSLGVVISVALLRVFAGTAAQGIDRGEQPHHHGGPASTGTAQDTKHG